MNLAVLPGAVPVVNPVDGLAFDVLIMVGVDQFRATSLGDTQDALGRLIYSRVLD